MNYLRKNTIPKVGDWVWFLSGQMADTPQQGKVIRINDIDRKGINNTYLDIKSDGKEYHASLLVVYDNKPVQERIKDDYGFCTVWA